MGKIIPIPIPSVPAESKEIENLFSTGVGTPVNATRANMDLIDFAPSVDTSVKWEAKAPNQSGGSNIIVEANLFDDSGGGGALNAVFSLAAYKNGVAVGTPPADLTVAIPDNGNLVKISWAILAADYAAGDSLSFELKRKGTDAADFYTTDIGLHSVSMETQLA